MRIDILKEIEHQDNVPSLLIHACCAPCSSYVIEYLSSHYSITIYYYNPNIYPETEYIRRINELKNFLKAFPHKVKFVEDSYIPNEFYTSIEGLEDLGERSKRCYECYKMRMEKAALMAKKEGFDYFATTLSISPYKVSEWLNEIGESLEKKHNIKYLYADFKKNNGYNKSIQLSKEYNLYRQEYCGCKFSINNKKK